MNPHESNEENSWSDTLNLLSDGLKGRLKNTASEKPCRQPPISETDSPAPFPPNARIFRPISQQQSAYPAKLPNVQQKHPTADCRAPPKHCGVAAGFPAKAAIGQNLYSNRSTIHPPGLRNLIGRPFRRHLRYKQIKNRSFADSAIDGTMSAIPKTIIPPP